MPNVILNMLYTVYCNYSKKTTIINQVLISLDNNIGTIKK